MRYACADSGMMLHWLCSEHADAIESLGGQLLQPILLVSINCVNVYLVHVCIRPSVRCGSSSTCIVPSIVCCICIHLPCGMYRACDGFASLQAHLLKQMGEHWAAHKLTIAVPQDSSNPLLSAADSLVRTSRLVSVTVSATSVSSSSGSHQPNALTANVSVQARRMS